jgi:hypothetical protein
MAAGLHSGDDEPLPAHTARPVWDHFGTTRCALWRTICASVHVLPREELPPDSADQRKRISAIFWGSSGRRFKSCQPDTVSPTSCGRRAGLGAIRDRLFAYRAGYGWQDGWQRHTDNGERSYRHFVRGDPQRARPAERDVRTVQRERLACAASVLVTGRHSAGGRICHAVELCEVPTSRATDLAESRLSSRVAAWFGGDNPSTQQRRQPRIAVR